MRDEPDARRQVRADDCAHSMIGMNDGTILHVRSISHRDALDVTADGGGRPVRRVVLNCFLGTSERDGF